MRKLIILLFLFGCIHQPPSLPTAPTLPTEVPTEQEPKSERLDRLEWEIDYLNYEQVNIQCFNFLDHCYFSTFDGCLNSKDKTRCLKQGKSECFAKHEKCIVSNYKHWQELNKRKGRKVLFNMPKRNLRD
jgi:hypothetical protein